MSELSPAAQAVLDAWENKLLPDVTCLTHDPEREALAAALRAVADQLGESRAPGAEFEHLYPPIIEVDDLLAIADELEAQ